MVKTRLSVSLLLLSLAACATDATPVDGQGDTAVADTGSGDTSTTDTAADTGTAPDTAADTAPDVEVEALDRDGAEPWIMKPAEFRAHIEQETLRWADIVKKAKIAIQ